MRSLSRGGVFGRAPTSSDAEIHRMTIQIRLLLATESLMRMLSTGLNKSTAKIIAAAIVPTIPAATPNRMATMIKTPRNRNGRKPSKVLPRSITAHKKAIPSTCRFPTSAFSSSPWPNTNGNPAYVPEESGLRSVYRHTAWPRNVSTCHALAEILFTRMRLPLAVPVPSLIDNPLWNSYRLD